MISVCFDTEDPYSIYGFHHFIQKYSFPFKIIRKEKSRIDLLYDNSEQNIDLNIQIKENEIKNDIRGWIKTKNESAPLFETPSDLILEGDSLVLYSNGVEEYPCIVQRDNNLIIGFGIFKEIGHILHGHLESLWISQHIDEMDKISKIPIVDVYEKIMFDCLHLCFHKHNIYLAYKHFWPNGKKFAVCLTYDVDRVKKTFQYVTHTIRHLKKGEINKAFTQMLSLLRRENPYWNFDKIMETEKRLGVKSTFFFLNEQRKASLFAPREWKLYLGRYDIEDPEIVKAMKKLDAEGWEIGVHGSYNSYRDLKMLEEEKRVIEKLIGKKVHGISQHYCNLDIPGTWEYHEKIELVYDATMGFVNEIGFRYGTCFPFHPFNAVKGRTLSLWELPIIIMDTACSFEKRGVWKECINVLNSVEKYNGVMLLRWHPTVFNEQEFPGRSEIYERIIEICKEKDAWITTTSSIAEWLTQREKTKGRLYMPGSNINSCG